jgi:hypothetical protein
MNHFPFGLTLYTRYVAVVSARVGIGWSRVCASPHLIDRIDGSGTRHDHPMSLSAYPKKPDHDTDAWERIAFGLLAYQPDTG